MVVDGGGVVGVNVLWLAAVEKEESLTKTIDEVFCFVSIIIGLL